MAAIHEPTRIVVIELPGCAPFAEVGIDPDAGASEVVWVGAPPRLAVLSRYAAHSTVHLLDPYGPRTIAEIRLEAPMKLAAAVGTHALAVGSLGAAVLTASDSHLTPYQFPARTVPVAAGAAANQFVVALAGSIEEWDPQTRMPKRRLKLPRPAVITAVGGSDRVVWMTTQQDPTRLDVFALVNRGQPKQHELPEPIAHVSSHPRSDLVVCLGADSGRLYVVDLDGRAGLRTIGPEGIDRVEAAGLVLGRMVGVLAAQAKRPITVVALDGRDSEAASVAVPSTLPIPREPRAAAGEAMPESKPSSLFGDQEDPTDHGVVEVPTSVTLQGHLAPEPQKSAPPAPPSAPGPVPPPAPPPTPGAKPSLFRQMSQASTAVPTKPATAKTHAPAQSLAERFSTWRDRMRSAQPRSGEGQAVGWIETRPSWRDELAAWVRGVTAGTLERNPPASPPIDTLLARFELMPQVAPALALLYGAHLCGDDGAAPVDVARVLGRNWDEALGKGQLHAAGVTSHRDSRVRLAPCVLAALDGLPPQSGTMVGEPGTIALLGPCVVVAGDDTELGIVAETCLPNAGGAILAGHAEPRDVLLEARAYGAVAMLRLPAGTLARLATDEPVILVVPDDATADALGVPRLA